ncbi:hypothetical protein F53441_5750 [Fusarium austroafricanum]|uniref:ZN622/Rei1/Reh1 zinc finger C2H2-type domain-containing protein n=1 Tax=Fusarium austroafricanum TaxID=2364996 RepID=A0A8H4NZB8_9HYPO|nr:hypothetical protein F53441_5750 [Fusarium austroafricanum]
MLGTTTTTTATTTTSPMLLSFVQESNPLTPNIMGSSKPSESTPSFTPGQCLFCPNTSQTLAESMIHMQKSHGLFIPQQNHLVVDLETLFRYLHLVIFEYRGCLHCGTERSTVQAVQQHMMGKGHCKIDVSEGSEFADFYNFSHHQLESNVMEDDEEERESAAVKPNLKPLQVDEDSIRLPSGRIISKKLSAQVEPSLSQPRHRTRITKPQLEYSSVEVDEEDSTPDHMPENSDTRLSRRERRQKATATYQLANMSAGDRSALMHLSATEQRSLITTQHRAMEKVQKDETRRQRKLDRKGNKNLYAYWNTETPVYQCG